MKRKVDTAEWYPVYSIGDLDSYGGYEIEVTEEQVAQWEAARLAFERSQDEMGVLYEAAEEAARERARAEKAEREAREKAKRDEARRQREAASRERQAAARRMIGTVYDAEGNPVGEVSEGMTGLTVRPIVSRPAE